VHVATSVLCEVRKMPLWPKILFSNI